VTAEGSRFLKEKTPLRLRHMARKPLREKRRSAAAMPAMEGDAQLFALLKSVRMQLAKTQNVPPYVIFHDKTLLEMAAHKPQEMEDFTLISGVGEKKAERYGPVFLQVIADYTQQAA
jgi:ATP-dependent DNA helicase RecQ